MMASLNWPAAANLPVAVQTICADDFPYHPGIQAFKTDCSLRRIRVLFAGGAVAMSIHDPVAEFRAAWLPHVTDDGLNRIIELLEKASPLLIHGAFTRALPMGCLASHIAWNHPKTSHFQHEAGVMWLAKVAGLNPATSLVILAWDRYGAGDFALRSKLLEACHNEFNERSQCKVRKEKSKIEESEAVPV